jgi:AGZA family xanthine/uracil permease-like MFS transporter
MNYMDSFEWLLCPVCNSKTRIGIVVTTIIAMIFGIAEAPKHWSDIISFSNPFASVAPIAFHLDIKAALEVGLVSIIFSLTIVDLFDNIGTLIGVSAKAGMLDKEGKLPRIGKALFADSLGTMFGALMGTSTVTSYVESAAGVSEGGKTGLTSLTIAILFILSLVFAPLVLFVPGQATAPALIIVGVLMMESITNIKFDDFTEALPAFLTIILMPLTYSIAQGLAFGFMSYTLVKLLAGRHHENSAVTYVVSIMFLLHFIVPNLK